MAILDTKITNKIAELLDKRQRLLSEINREWQSSGWNSAPVDTAKQERELKEINKFLAELGYTDE